MISWLSGLLAAGWLAAVLAGLWQFTQASLVEFDPELRLLSWQQNPQAQKAVARLKSSLPTATQGVLVHVGARGCRCDAVAATHRNRVAGQAQQLGITNHFTSIEQQPYLAELLPAVPATLLFDQNGQLVYLGPYASGVNCSAKQGMLDPWLPPAKWRILPQAAIVTDAQGCYCHT